eukprot:Hpha_TRINITY_DN29981_c0_g1::TRINITY_DN29981_c0_g1_i1::g.131972::m.131972
MAASAAAAGRHAQLSQNLLDSPWSGLRRPKFGLTGARDGLIRNVKVLHGRTGKVLGGAIGGAMQGGIVDGSTRGRSKKEPEGPLSADGWIVKVELIKDFLLKVAGDVAERPRKFDFFLYLINLLSITALCLMHITFSNERPLFEMQRSIETGVFGGPNFDDFYTGSFMDITGEDEFWTWMLDVFPYKVWESHGDKGTVFVSESNHVLGPVVLRMLRTEVLNCTGLHGMADELKAELFREGCVTKNFDSTPFGKGNVTFMSDKYRIPDGQTWDSLLVPMTVEVRTRHSTYYPTDQVFSWFIPSQGTLDDAKRQIQMLKDGGWVDHRTRLFEIEAVVFNRNIEAFLTISAWMEVTTTGHFITNHRLRPFTITALADVPAGPLVLILDLVIGIGAILGCVRLIRKAWHVWLIRRSMVYVFTFWNMVQIAVFVLLCNTAVLRFYLFFLAETVWETWPSNSTLADPAMSRQWVSLRDYGDYYHSMLQVMSYTACLVWLWGISFLEHLPKLALLTETVHSAFAELFGVLVLLTFMMVAFTLMVSLLYGHGMEDYSTAGRTMSTLFQIALDFGNLKYIPMDYLEPKMTSFVLIVFTFLIWVLILNMLLAVITEAFVRTARERRGTDRLSMQLMIMGIIKTTKNTMINGWRGAKSFFRCGDQSDALRGGADDEAEVLHGALFGSLDEKQRLEVEYFQTVSSTKKLLCLATTINSLTAWEDEIITFEQIKELPVKPDEPDGERVELTPHQISLLERFFIHTGKTPEAESPTGEVSGLSPPEASCSMMLGSFAGSLGDGNNNSMNRHAEQEFVRRIAEMVVSMLGERQAFPTIKRTQSQDSDVEIRSAPDAESPTDQPPYTALESARAPSPMVVVDTTVSPSHSAPAPFASSRASAPAPPI